VDSSRKSFSRESFTNYNLDEAAAAIDASIDEKQCTLWVEGVCVAILDYRRQKVASNLRASTLVKQFSHLLDQRRSLYTLSYRYTRRSTISIKS